MPLRFTTLAALRTHLKALASPEKAKASAWFFKTGPGEYAEGDQFIGITVPELRTTARACKDLSLPLVERLLRSKIHEERLLALLLFVDRMKSADPALQRHLYERYLAHTSWINNWDLVDTSAAPIVGRVLASLPTADIRKTLTSLAASPLLWERRIAMVATLYWIKRGEPNYTLLIAEQLLPDRHDLIQKAVGWMLREVGKHCDKSTLEMFLTQHLSRMGRTSLRYAIEHFPEPIRQQYLRTPRAL